MRAFKSVSPSQFNTFFDCKRQWWFQSILGLPTPQRASAALGEAVHSQLEAYADSGKLPDDTEAGRIAKAGLSLLPEPGTSWTEVKMHNEETQEQWPRIYLSGVPVNGYVDLLNLTGPRPLIIDHKCLPASAVVHTDAGPVPVGKLAAEWTCAAWDGQQIVPTKALAPVDAGVQRVFRIGLKNGMVGRYGETHPLLTRRGWIPAADVQVSDTVAVALGLPDTAGIPVSDALIKVVAMLLCDGTLVSDTLTYTKTGAARSEYMRCLSELGVPFSERVRPGRAPYVRVSAAVDSPLRTMLQSVGVSFVRSPERCIPPMLMGMNRRQVGIFLGGMWAGDGAAYIVHADGREKPVVTFAGRSRRLCEGVRDLLLRVGIPATLTSSSVSYKQRRVPYYAATVVGKQGKLDFLRRALSGEIAVGDRCTGRLTRSKRVPPTLTDVLRATEATASYPAGAFPIRTEGALWWVPVAETLLDGSELCFDIEVPGLHTFVAEGVVTHNTTSDLKYAKTKDELRSDPQMVIYGSFALAACDAQGIEATEVDAGHIVYLTRGAPAARKTLVTLDRKHLAAERQKLEPVVEEMRALSKEPSPDRVPGEPSSCNKYGGCHFRDKCRALSSLDAPPSLSFAERFRESTPSTTTPSENTMSIDPLAALAAIKARKAAEAAGAPAPTPAPAPATPAPTPAPAAEVAAPVSDDAQEAARAALLAKYGIKKPGAPAAAAEAPVSIVPPDAPPQTKPSAFTSAPAPATPAAEPEDKKAVRKPKNYAEKLAALNWTEAQIGRMTPESMREAIDGNLNGTLYTVLKDGAIMLPAPAVESDPMPYKPETIETVPAVAPVAATPAPVAAPVPAPAPEASVPALVLYIDCAPEKGREREYMTLEDYIQPLCAEAVAIHNRGAKDAERVDFYGLIPYNRGPTYIAAMLMKAPPTGVIVCNTRYPATNACLEVLTPFADVIVRASR